MILACTFSSGCVSRAVYPDTWAEQVEVESGTCPVIDGEYQNAGELFTRGRNDRLVRNEVSLVDVFNEVAYDTPTEILGSDQVIPQGDDRPGIPFPESLIDHYQTIHLRLVEGKLHVEATLAGGSTRTIELSTRQQCRDSILLLEVDWYVATYVLMINVAERATYALGRAEDGSLLVRAGSGGGLFILQWPILAAGGSDWMRFPAVAGGTGIIADAAGDRVAGSTLYATGVRSGVRPQLVCEIVAVSARPQLPVV